jgi:transcriptional regulator with XRE-family HTH domain
MDTIGSRLEAERERLGMTQVQFASHIGIAQSTYNEYKSGKKAMGVDAFMKVCASLKWTPEFLFYGQGVKMSTARTFAEAKLLKLFRDAPEDQHEMIFGMIKVAIENANKGKRAAG